jgi:hypothetical protein
LVGSGRIANATKMNNTAAVRRLAIMGTPSWV